MNPRRLQELQLRPSKRTLFGLAVILPLFLLLDYFALFSYAKNLAGRELDSRLDTIRQDVEFSDKGQIIVRKLYSDSLGPDPYVVLSTDGLMLDHGPLPAGFYDKVSVDELKKAATPILRPAETDKTWRVLAKPVNQGDKTVGYVTVGGIFDASGDDAAKNQLLENAAKAVGGGLTVEADGTLSTKNLRPRDLQGIISAFGIVTADGTLLEPSFGAYPYRVDTAAVDRAKQAVGKRQDFVPQGERYGYLVSASELKDGAGNTKAIAVAAAPLKAIEELLQVQVMILIVLLALFAGAVVILSAPRFLTRRGMLSVSQALQIGESSRIEFKEILPAGNSLSKHVAGFANTQGGAIYIGIADDGQVVGVGATLENDRKQHIGMHGDRTQKGLHNIDQVERQIMNDVRNIISPPADVILDKLEHKGKTVIRLTVNESRGTVHTVGGVMYVRHGSQTVPAKSEEILRLVRTRV